MEDCGVNRAKRFVAVVAAMLLAITIIFSSLYLPSTHEHECSHEESCAVCVAVEACKDLSNNLAAALCALFMAVFAIVLTLLLPSLLIGGESLVHLKTRLNN